jgi:hypothetical protein
MESNNLPGLTPIAILVLFVALTFLLSAGIPIVLASEPVKVSDWLGFSGAVVSALVTLGAAVIAWRAVQRQIEAQRVIAERQAAIQSYDVLHRLATTLEDELRLAFALAEVATRASIIDEFRQKQPVDIITAGLLHSQYQSTKDRLKAVRSEWAVADTKRWQFRNALDARMDLEGAIVELEQRLETGTALLLMIKDAVRADAKKVAERQKILDGISFTDVVKNVLIARTNYTKAINGEIASLLPKLDETRLLAKL